MFNLNLEEAYDEYKETQVINEEATQTAKLEAALTTLQIAVEKMDPNRYISIRDVMNTIRTIGQHFHSENLRFEKIKNDHKSKLIQTNNYSPETKGHIKKLTELLNDRDEYMKGIDKYENQLDNADHIDRHNITNGILEIRDSLAKNSDEFNKVCNDIEKCHKTCESKKKEEVKATTEVKPKPKQAEEAKPKETKPEAKKTEAPAKQPEKK